MSKSVIPPYHSTPEREKKSMQLAKGFSILAVVALHFLAFFPDTIYTHPQDSWFFLAINQLTRFSVPLFIALSGFGLARKYQQQPLNRKEFLWSRFQKLLPAYLLWTGILLIILQISQTWNQGDIQLWQGLFFGKTDYHLYFVPIIFQLYFLFTFVEKLKQRWQVFLLLAFMGSLQAAWFAFIRFASLLPELSIHTWLLSDQFQYRLLTNWVFYFLVGIFASQVNLERVRKIPRVGLMLGIIAGASLMWSILDAQTVILQTHNIVYATGFTRLSVFVYASAVIALVLLYGHHLLRLPVANHSVFFLIGKYSYMIYLSHTLGLRILEGVIAGGPRLSTLTLAGALFLVGVMYNQRIT